MMKERILLLLIEESHPKAAQAIREFQKIAEAVRDQGMKLDLLQVFIDFAVSTNYTEWIPFILKNNYTYFFRPNNPKMTATTASEEFLYRMGHKEGFFEGVTYIATQSDYASKIEQLSHWSKSLIMRSGGNAGKKESEYEEIIAALTRYVNRHFDMEG